MTIKEILKSPFRVFYILDWGLIIGSAITGILTGIIYHPIFLFILVLCLCFAFMMNLPFLSRKVRYTKSYKVFFKGLINAHKRVWKYFKTLDHDELQNDIINGD